MTSAAEETRVPALDGVRGIAILLVMAHHFAQHLLPRHPIDQVVLSVTRAGWIGVDLFFVLSGFLITGILYDTRQARNYFRSFYARRILRIFPLYYAALAVMFVLPRLVGIDVLDHTNSHWPWYWLYVSNVLTATDGWNSRFVAHFWSLAIEEQFYLVWPLLVFLLPRRWLLGLCGGMIVVAAVMRGLLYDAGAGTTANFTFTLTRADALAMGAGVALLMRSPRGPAYLRRLAPWVCGFALPAAVIALWSSGGVAWDMWGPPGQVGGYTIIALASAAVVAWSVTSPGQAPLNRFFGSRSLGFLGKYSYAMYVIHMPVDTALRFLDLHVLRIGGTLGIVTPALVVTSILAGAITVGLALVSWHLVESPFLRLKRHFHPVFAPTPGQARPSPAPLPQPAPRTPANL